MPLGEKMENPDEDPYQGKPVVCMKYVPVGLTDISRLSTIVRDERTHSVRQGFNLFFGFILQVW